MWSILILIEDMGLLVRTRSSVVTVARFEGGPLSPVVAAVFSLPWLCLGGRGTLSG